MRKTAAISHAFKKTLSDAQIASPILLMHVKDEVLKAGKIVDLIKFDVIGRLSGGTRYCGVGSVFEIDSAGAKKR